MPFINIRTYKGALSKEEKKALQLEITELLVKYEGKGNPEFKKFVSVMIEEEDATNWMISGLNTRELIDSNPTFKKVYLSNLSEKK